MSQTDFLTEGTHFSSESRLATLRRTRSLYRSRSYEITKQRPTVEHKLK
jgi:hypothetical protein